MLNGMAERGGPTTQSGIFYQNSIAALFLARLCDRKKRDLGDQVVEVRSEVPGASVDDIVVSFGDGHKMWIQAKENLPTSGSPWDELWANFNTQFGDASFGPRDRLTLYLGTNAGVFEEIREATERARGSTSADEWLSRLTKGQQEVITKVKACVSLNETQLWRMMARVHVAVLTSDSIERDLAPFWVPSSNHETRKLLSLLRDKVGGRSRIRKTFQSDEFQTELHRDGVIFDDETCADEHTLVTLGPGITMSVPQSTMTTTPSLWGFEIGRFVTGDRQELYAYAESFYSLHEAFHTVTCNAYGCGRQVVSPPRISGKTLLVDVERPRRRTFSQIAFTDEMDLAISDDGMLVEVTGKAATENQVLLSLAHVFGETKTARYAGSVVARICKQSSCRELSERVKAEILRLSVFDVQSIVQLRNVNAEYQSDTSTLRIEIALDDVRDGRHEFTRCVPLERAEPAAWEVSDLRAVQGSRVERTLRALRASAAGAEVEVSLTELLGALYEPEAGERDLQRCLEILKDRGDIMSWSLASGCIRATLSGIWSNRMELMEIKP